MTTKLALSLIACLLLAGCSNAEPKRLYVLYTNCIFWPVTNGDTITLFLVTNGMEYRPTDE